MQRGLGVEDGISYYCETSERYRVRLTTGEILVCSRVYEPAEDTWLAVDCLAEACPRQGSATLCVDVGTGTGVLAVECSRRCGSRFIVAIDLNPCATKCAKKNALLNGIDHLAEIVQCNRMSCLRGLKGVLLVYNTPYIEDDYHCSSVDECLEELAVVGGSREVKAFVEEAAGMENACILLVFSSTSFLGQDPRVSISSIVGGKGFRVKVLRKEHFFFEDIYCAFACK